LERSSALATSETVAAPAQGGGTGIFIGPDDTAQSLRDEYLALLCSLLTIWLGFVVIASCGFVLSAWLAWMGEAFDLSKPMLLWLPFAIIAATGPVWLPVTAWVERRDLRMRLALVAEREGRRG
jgi:hypothetical protein